MKQTTSRVSIRYQFINESGYPVGNTQPTMEDAEAVAKFHNSGRFYSIELSELGQVFMRYHHSKGMA